MFGDVLNGKVSLNKAGEMAKRIWQELPLRFTAIRLDSFVVMPNHVHGILIVKDPVGASLVGVRSAGVKKTSEATANTQVVPTLGDVVGAYKSIATVKYVQGVKMDGWWRFQGRLWQRNYYERVIRDDAELERAREYIANNPIEWELDPENPKT